MKSGRISSSRAATFHHPLILSTKDAEEAQFLEHSRVFTHGPRSKACELNERDSGENEQRTPCLFFPNQQKVEMRAMVCLCMQRGFYPRSSAPGTCRRDLVKSYQDWRMVPLQNSVAVGG
jgi:hypothetical protein